MGSEIKGCVCVCVCVCACMLFSQLCPTLCDPMDCSPPGSSVHAILQVRIWNGLPFPPPGDLPNPSIKPRSPALQADLYCLSHHGSPEIQET